MPSKGSKISKYLDIDERKMDAREIQIWGKIDVMGIPAAPVSKEKEKRRRPCACGGAPEDRNVVNRSTITVFLSPWHHAVSMDR